MKFNSLALVSLILMGTIAPTICTMAQQSETVQGVPQQNDRRAPVAAKVNPSKPIQIRVVNQSNVEIQAMLAEPTSSERKVQPQQSITFGTLHTSFLPPPIDLTFYTNSKDTNLHARVTVVKNELIVTVTAKPGANGLTRSIHVNKTGAIFIY